MKYEVREDTVLISGYVNAVERLSKPIRSTLHGKFTTFLERIKAGVFRSALKKNDEVFVLLNHDTDRVLATTKDGTAKLEEDNIGLRAEITITDKEVVQKAREGKLTGWSFGFIANDDEVRAEGETNIRTVTDMELIEVSILDDTKSPAYYGTSIEAREGGARMVERRVDEFTEEPATEETTETTEEVRAVDIDKLADLVAERVSIRVLEALKPEEETTEEQTEEVEEQTEEQEETPEEENRSIDYSAFEERLSKIKK